MLQRHHHGDGRRGLVGDDGGPFVLRNPRGHTQQGQVRTKSTAVHFTGDQFVQLDQTESLDPLKRPPNPLYWIR